MNQKSNCIKFWSHSTHKYTDYMGHFSNYTTQMFLVIPHLSKFSIHFPENGVCSKSLQFICTSSCDLIFLMVIYLGNQFSFYPYLSLPPLSLAFAIGISIKLRYYKGKWRIIPLQNTFHALLHF